IRRNHFIYFDDALALTYKPGGLSCEPFRQYNTQGNGIYSPQPRPLWQWQQISNWCPGDKIPIRSISLGSLSAGTHSFRIDVPDATFNGGQGYFPMSVYLQGFGATLGTPEIAAKNFSIYPNPASDIATISSSAEVKTVNVFNTLGQVVLTAKTKELNLSSLNSGMYMVQIQFADNTTATRKIVKN
ncbi:MAG: T9SS type A sorting domain-containing protein, partial [Pedobacter sp.]